MNKLESFVSLYDAKKPDAQTLVKELEEWLDSPGTLSQELVNQIRTLYNEGKIPAQIYQKINQQKETVIDKTVILDETQIQDHAVDPTVVISDPTTAEPSQTTHINLQQSNPSDETVADDKTVINPDIKTHAAINETKVAPHISELETQHSASQNNSNQTLADLNQTTVADNTPTIIRTDETTGIEENYQTINETRAENSSDATFITEHTTKDFTQPFDTGQRKKVELKPGGILKDRFILKNIIGSGGMSVVFRALDLRKQEAKNRSPFVAIKVLGDVFKHHPQSLLVLERETHKIQSLAHPNIITVYDFDRDGDTIYMTMECLEGQSLDAVIRDHKQGLHYSKAIPIIKGMCRALQYAHSKDIIHSDFKPENVFYTKDNQTKVLDFGIARAKQVPERKKNDTVFDVGSLSALTPPYASLEMLEHREPDIRDDIYALGCVTYKLLTGVHPYKNLQANQARDAELKPKRIKELNRRQWQTLSDSLEFEREKRLKTVEEFIDGIELKTRSRWFYAILIGILISIGVSAYLGKSLTKKPLLPQLNLSEKQLQKIEDFKETAEFYYSLGNLATPPGDSAYDLYNKILEIDPTNQDAIKGKKDIAGKYYNIAKAKCDVSAWNECEEYVKTGLIIEPENKDLLELQKTLVTR